MPRKTGHHRQFSKYFAILPVAALAMLLPQGPISAQQQGPYTVQESGRSFTTLVDAVNSIGNGQGTIIIAPGQWQDCAVQQGGNITYRAASPGRVVFDGGVCEGKATLVLKGAGATVDGIIFQNTRVPDGNGAGIRLERGNLTVVNSWFRSAEEGILSHDDPNSTITIDRSTFTRLGRCDRGLSCAHSIYIGNYGALNVTRSRFEAGSGGHYVKSRSSRIKVLDSSFDDSQGQTTNYMIDLPAGATGEIANNIFVQGQNKENHSAFIAVAAETRDHSSAGLSIHDNVAALAPGVQRNTTFVANWSDDQINIGTNKLGTGLQKYQKR